MPESPLSVGNGSLCFTVDPTGLQTWPSAYPVTGPAGGVPGTLLSTMSDWGWHSAPGGEAYDVAHCAREYETRRGPVPYADVSGSFGGLGPGAGLGSTGFTEEEAWLRANPHRLDLLRAGFAVPSGAGWAAPDPGDADGFDQRLDLWTGTITSAFRLGGVPVTTRTACHPLRDVIAVRVASPLLAAGRIAVRLAFPYGSQSWNNAAEWTIRSAHETVIARTRDGFEITRALDGADVFAVAGRLPASAVVSLAGRHEVIVSSADDTLEFTLALSPGAVRDTDSFDAVAEASRQWWADYWSRGAAIDVTGSSDPRAGELQRRIMLSQYLTVINCAGSLPPQETGLIASSWHGKFHLEMHWWHAAHFAQWGRPDLLERSLSWYSRILPAARDLAAGQGYAGARWPKQCGPDGAQTPSPISPFLIWQQPHPVHLAELARAAGSPGALERYADVVFESARFMASFADATSRGFELGPPLVPAQESYAGDRASLANPTFELAYWSWALRVAVRWRSLLGLAPEPSWSEVADGLVAPPAPDGVYEAVEVSGQARTVRDDHPSMLFAYGFTPPTPLIDPAVMRATLRSVLDDWNWDSAWGWDFPAVAMTAARLGSASGTIESLLMDAPKNTYLPNGHNRQSPSLPAYLPGNGGLLSAVALMARTGTFPDGWQVVHDGFVTAAD